MEWRTEQEKLNDDHQEAIYEHHKLIIVKKEQIITILRELSNAEAQFVLNDVKRWFLNDEIDAKFFAEE